MTITNNYHRSLLKNDSLNESQFYTENNVLGAALNRLTLSTSQNTINNCNDETCTTPNEGVSVASVPKNVKFHVPLSRSDMNSNESTFGVIDSTTAPITHVKDIFPLTSLSKSQTRIPKMDNDGRDLATVSSSSVSLTTSSLFNVDYRLDQNDIIGSNSEQQVLLQNNGSNQQ